MASFTLDTTTQGTVLTVDGVDISGRTRGISLTVDGSNPPELTVYTTAGGTVTGDGVVTVVTPPQASDVMGAVADFLELLDPVAVTAEVESRFVTIGQSPIALTLEVLIAYAREASDG